MTFSLHQGGVVLELELPGVNMRFSPAGVTIAVVGGPTHRPRDQLWDRARNAEHLGQFVFACAEFSWCTGGLCCCEVQGSLILSAPGILWSTPPVHVSNGGHWKARSLVWNLLFLISAIFSGAWSQRWFERWWWFVLRKPHSCALS